MFDCQIAPKLFPAAAILVTACAINGHMPPIYNSYIDASLICWRGGLILRAWRLTCFCNWISQPTSLTIHILCCWHGTQSFLVWIYHQENWVIVLFFNCAGHERRNWEDDPDVICCRETRPFVWRVVRLRTACNSTCYSNRMFTLVKMFNQRSMPLTSNGMFMLRTFNAVRVVVCSSTRLVVIIIIICYYSRVWCPWTQWQSWQDGRPSGPCVCRHLSSRWSSCPAVRRMGRHRAVLGWATATRLQVIIIKALRRVRVVKWAFLRPSDMRISAGGDSWCYTSWCGSSEADGFLR